eukprot:TRINITY_DN54141_c0_g1_i1.p1 TRINITY_DN54141_c0_g1~~TRINITY_DN54141_c0_g1_i1.p1  ORF type:complete len:118 (-),score=11.01 TRINITY_DN54141_c0_g1_i1:62-415(-)
MQLSYNVLEVERFTDAPFSVELMHKLFDIIPDPYFKNVLKRQSIKANIPIRRLREILKPPTSGFCYQYDGCEHCVEELSTLVEIRALRRELRRVTNRTLAKNFWLRETEHLVRYMIL